MSATTGSEPRSGIGARLKAGRERMGMTILQVAEKLHVDPKVLEALEAERFNELGAVVYAKGHLKRYAELTGEDIGQLLDLYATVTQPPPPDLTQLPKAAHHADPRKLVLPSLVVLIAFVLVGTVWWVLQNLEGPATFGKPAVPQAVDVPLDSEGGATDPQAPPAGDASSATSTSAGTSASAPGQPRAASPAANAGQSAGAGQAASATQNVRRVRGTGTRAGTTAGTASTTRITKASRLPAGSAAADAARARSVNVTLRFAADSWAEVYDANGQRLFYDVGAAKSSRALSGVPPLRVVLGNASGVSLNINGRRARVPASVLREDGAEFTIDRSGRIVRTPADAAASPESKPNGE